MVARSRTFTQAAEALGRSQPAVSMLVRSLESELGLALVESSGRHLRLTAAGTELLRHADRVLSSVVQAERAIELIRGGGGPLRVGASATPAIYLLPDVLGILARQHPEVSVRLRVDNPAALETALTEGEIDLAVAMGGDERPPWYGMLETAPLGRDPLRVVLPAGDRRAGQEWSLDALREERLIVREPGSHVRAVVERCLGRDFQPALEFGSNEGVKRAVATGLGVAVLSQMALAWEVEAERLAVANCSGLGPPRRAYMARRRDERRTQVEAALWEALRSCT